MPRTHVSPMMQASAPAAAPTWIAARGPNSVATHPAIGAPMGVAPMMTAM